MHVSLTLHVEVSHIGRVLNLRKQLFAIGAHRTQVGLDTLMVSVFELFLATLASVNVLKQVYFKGVNLRLGRHRVCEVLVALLRITHVTLQVSIAGAWAAIVHTSSECF